VQFEQAAIIFLGPEPILCCSHAAWNGNERKSFLLRPPGDSGPQINCAGTQSVLLLCEQTASLGHVEDAVDCQTSQDFCLRVDDCHEQSARPNGWVFFVKKAQPTKKIDLVVSAEVTLAAMESFLTHSCFSESA